MEELCSQSLGTSRNRNSRKKLLGLDNVAKELRVLGSNRLSMIFGDHALNGSDLMSLTQFELSRSEPAIIIHGPNLLLMNRVIVVYPKSFLIDCLGEEQWVLGGKGSGGGGSNGLSHSEIE